jgi:hypothetical protein
MRKGLLALVATAVVLSGCARHRFNDDEIGSGYSATLDVVNHHWGDVDVYVVHDGQRSRVGTVTAAAEQAFTLAPSQLGNGGTLQLQAHAVGMAGGLNSETINVRPGGMQITWTIESNLARATLAIY